MVAHRVLLYGCSLFILSIEANLRLNPMLELVRVDVATADLFDQLRKLEPAVIVFDRMATTAESLLHLLLEQPALVLIGLDADRDQALVLSSQSSTVMSAKDLSLLLHSNFSRRNLAEREQ